MGIITAVLVAGGMQKDFHVPAWVIAASSLAIGLGTMSGGWRIVRTMGTRLTRLQPRSGFCAETGAAISILFATYLGLPVSSTHAIAGAIAGVGSIQRTRAVRWHVAGGIVTAWVLTIPASAVVAAIVYYGIRLFVPAGDNEPDESPPFPQRRLPAHAAPRRAPYDWSSATAVSSTFHSASTGSWMWRFGMGKSLRSAATSMPAESIDATGQSSCPA